MLRDQITVKRSKQWRRNIPDKPQGGDAGNRAPEAALGLDLERLERDELPSRLFSLRRGVRVPRPEGDRTVWRAGSDEVCVRVVSLEEGYRGDGRIERGWGGVSKV